VLVDTRVAPSFAGEYSGGDLEVCSGVVGQGERHVARSGHGVTGL